MVPDSQSMPICSSELFRVSAYTTKGGEVSRAIQSKTLIQRIECAPGGWEGGSKASVGCICSEMGTKGYVVPVLQSACRKLPFWIDFSFCVCSFQQETFLVACAPFGKRRDVPHNIPSLLSSSQQISVSALSWHFRNQNAKKCSDRFWMVPMSKRVHAAVARSTFRSQNGKNTCSDHFWDLRCQTKIMPLWREAPVKVKMLKASKSI